LLAGLLLAKQGTIRGVLGGIAVLICPCGCDALGIKRLIKRLGAIYKYYNHRRQKK
jgi:hypothetical protein